MLPQRRRDFRWDRARRRLGLAGDAIYDNDTADRWAEEEMLAEALGHWNQTGRPLPRYRWWNRVPLRDLDTERQLALAEFESAESAGQPGGIRRLVSMATLDNLDAGRPSPQTMADLLYQMRRRRPRRNSDSDWLFVLGGKRNYIAIQTRGPATFIVSYPVWDGRTFEGSMLFSLGWSDTQTVANVSTMACESPTVSEARRGR